MTWLYAPWHRSEFSPSAAGSEDSSEGSDELSAPTCALWVLSSGKATLQPSSWREWKKKRWWRVLTGATRSGTTSQPSTDDCGLAAWTSSLRDTHVSPNPAPASDAASSTSDGSGTRSGVSFARWDRATSTWKTWQLTFLGHSDEWSETWPRAGGVSSGIAYPQPPSAPLTSVIGSSFLLPTPVASPYVGSNQNGSNGDRPSAGSPSLTTMARHDMLPTPTTRANQRGKHGTGTIADYAQRYCRRRPPGITRARTCRAVWAARALARWRVPVCCRRRPRRTASRAGRPGTGRRSPGRHSGTTLTDVIVRDGAKGSGGESASRPRFVEYMRDSRRTTVELVRRRIRLQPQRGLGRSHPRPRQRRRPASGGSGMAHPLGTNPPIGVVTRALVLAERIEMHASATTWSKKHGTQMNLELVG